MMDDQVTSVPSVSDHDLLIGLAKDMQYMINELKGSKTETTEKLGNHEGRIKVLETLQLQQTVAVETKQKMSTSAKTALGILFTVIGIIEPLALLYLTK